MCGAFIGGVSGGWCVAHDAAQIEAAVTHITAEEISAIHVGFHPLGVLVGGLMGSVNGGIYGAAMHEMIQNSSKRT